MNARQLIPIRTLLEGAIPAQWVEPVGDALELIALDPVESHTEWTAQGLFMRHRLWVLDRLSLDLPLIPGARIEVGRAGELPSFEVGLRTAPRAEVIVDDLGLTLWLPGSVLRPYEKVAEGWSPLDGGDRSADFPLTWAAGLRADLDGDLDIPFPADVATQIGVAHAGMVADSGFILDFGGEGGGNAGGEGGLRMVFGVVPEAIADKVPPGFRGVYVPRLSIAYFDPDDPGTGLPAIDVEDAAIGSGGFSGALSFLYADPVADLEDDEVKAGLDELIGDRDAAAVEIKDSEPGSGDTDKVLVGRLAGFVLVAHRLEIDFVQSLPTGSALEGYAYLPFVEKWTAFRIALGGPDGDFMLELEGAGEEALIGLENEWIEIKAESIEYFVRDGVNYAAVCGSLRPKIEGFDWPEFRIERLLISSEGDIEVDGGWIEMPERVTLDFFGFSIGIDKVGLGSEGEEAERRQWLGFAGEVSLVEGIPLSGSVDGLKVSWDPNDAGADPVVTLKGIGVHLEIPGALVLDGSVEHREVKEDEHGLSGHLFAGHVTADLPALKTEVAAELMVGRLARPGEEFTVFYLLLDAELPTQIPLGATGTAIRRLRGLFGAHVAPDRHLLDGEPEPWYEWYKAERGGDSARSVTSVKKWAGLAGNYGFGAGLGIGTQFDDGYSLNADALVAILLPGPVVMIEGRANLLSPPAAEEAESGAFYALAVFDGRAGTFQLNVDVAYSLARVIEAGGGLEAFFDFTDAGNWHLHLGKKEPDSKRIHASLLALFTANAYLMIDNRGLQTGAFVGFEWSAGVGPISLSLIARISVDAGIFWKPLLLEGSLAVHGEVALRAFGIGLSLMIDALLEGRAPRPYRVYGSFAVELELFWPLPKLKAQVELEWAEADSPKPVEPLLTALALAHHKQVGAAWELRALSAAPTALEDWKVFPVDIRPVLSFARPLFELSKRRTDDGDELPVERDKVADREFAYRLSEAMLEVRDERTGAWSVVRRGPVGEGSGAAFLVDQHSFSPDWAAQQPQLELWRYGALNRTMTYQREGYASGHRPCPAPAQAPLHCVDWRYVAEGTRYPPEFRHRRVRFLADTRPGARSPEVSARTLLSSPLTVSLPEPAATLSVEVGSAARMIVYGEGRRLGERASFGAGLLRYGGPQPVDAFRIFSTREAVPARPIASPGLWGAVRRVLAWPLAALADMIAWLAGVVGGKRSSGTGAKQVDTRAPRVVEDETKRAVGPAPATVSGTGPSGSDATRAPRPLGPLELRSICYRTARELEAERGGASPSGSGATRPEPDPGAAVLDPDREYKLTISTETEIAGEGDRTQEQSAFFFRTDSGPGTAPTHAEHVGTPLDDLATYVAASRPAPGAPCFYRGYDLRLEFNESYVPSMYKEPLRIGVRDRNGKPVGVAEGGWDSATPPSLDPGLLTLLLAQREGGCPGAGAGSGSPGAGATLLRPAPAELAPRHLYVAEVLTDGREDAEQPLYSLQFTASRYGTATAHLSSGLAEGTNEQVVRVLPAGPRPPLGWVTDHDAAVDALDAARGRLREAFADGADALALAEALADADAAAAAVEEKDRATFDLLDRGDGGGYPGVQPRFEAVELGHRPLPPAVELVRLDVEGSADRFLLLESPEPIEWRRVTFAGTPVRTVWSGDRTRAFIFPRDGNWFTASRIRLRLSYSGAAGLSGGLVTVAGAPVEESVKWIVALD